MDLWAYLGLNPKEIRIQGAIAYVPIADGRKGGKRSVQQSARMVQHMLTPAAVSGEGEEERRGTRGVIREFSDASRRRFERALRKVRWGNGALFVTLTFDKSPGERKAKKHLTRFLQWLRDRYPGVCYGWKMEYQKRGAVHFHLILTWPERKERPPWLSKDAVAEEWGQGFVKILFVRDKGLLRYLCKYVSKRAEADSSDADAAADGRIGESVGAEGAGGGPAVRMGTAGADEAGRLDKMSIKAEADVGADAEGGSGVDIKAEADAEVEAESVDNWVGRFWALSKKWPKAPVILASALSEVRFKWFCDAVEDFLVWLLSLPEHWAGVYQVSLPFFAS